MPTLESQIKAIDNKIKDLQKEIQSLAAQKIPLFKKTSFVCGCGKRHKIGELTYIQTHWYVRPSGCMGGDYWNEGEGHYICPNSNVRYRLYGYDDIAALKHFFKDIVKEHKDGYYDQPRATLLPGRAK